MKSTVGKLLAESMSDSRLRLLTADLGYRMFDEAWKTGRCINVGASEQTMIGIAVGMTYSGLVPICYSITPFLLYRPFEWIRNYLDYEKAPVKLIGSGRDDDYKNLGFSHWSFEQKDVMSLFPNIRVFYPESSEDLKDLWDEFLDGGPAYLNIRR